MITATSAAIIAAAAMPPISRMLSEDAGSSAYSSLNSEPSETNDTYP